MSKNNNKKEYDQTITLTDPDTGVTLHVPSENVRTWDDDYTITIDTSTDTSDYITTAINSGIFSEHDFRSIYERPSDKHIRKRYVGHKKIDDVSDIGIHTLEKMSKRGDK